ncbi:MAG: alcohol dehydrogenase catalytic domain-containing protein [Pseudomonadota bacterium]
MRQLTLTGVQTLEWWDVPAPRITSDREAVVRPMAVARCDLDVYQYLGAYTRPPPYAFGHEAAGEVVEVGDAVTAFEPGDRVVIPFQISCGECPSCRRGWTNACTAVPPLASYGLGTHPDGDWGGALSDLMLIPFADAMLLPLPAGVSLAQACGAGDNVADGYRTVASYLQRFPKEPILIAGGLAQSLGLYAAMAAVALGSSRVVYTDSDPRRLAAAAAIGAEAHSIDYGTVEKHEDGFLITVDASGTAEGLAFALRSTAPCGFCTGVSAGLGRETSLPTGSMYLKGVTYDLSRVHSRTVLGGVLDCLCEHRIDPLAIGARELPFSAAADAMAEPDLKLIFVSDEEAA